MRYYDSRNPLLDGVHPAGLRGWLGSIAGFVLIVSLLGVGLVNEASGCRRDNTENCILVQHVWGMGL